MDRPSTEPQGLSWRDVLQVLSRRKAVIILVAVCIAATVAVRSLREPDRYRASATLLVKSKTPRSVVLGPGGSSMISVLPILSEAKILQSRPVMEGAIQDLNPSPQEDEELARQVEVKVTKEADLIEVAYTSTDPVRAAETVNAIVQGYMSCRLEMYQNGDEYQFLDRQLGIALERLNSLERSLEEQGAPVSLEQQERVLTPQLEDVQRALNATETEIVVKKAQLTALETQLKRGYRNVSPPSGGANIGRWRLVNTLQDKLLSLELERDQLLQQYTPQDGVVARMDEQIERTEARLRTEISGILDIERLAIHTLEEEARALKDRVTALTQDVVKVQQDKAELARLSRDLDDNAAIYSMLLRRREEARIDHQSLVDIPNVQVLEPAVVPSAPVGPPRARYIAVGALIGLALGIAAAFFLEYVDDSIRTSEDVEQRIGLPFLGSIPEVRR